MKVFDFHFSLKSLYSQTLSVHFVVWLNLLPLLIKLASLPLFYKGYSSC